MKTKIILSCLLVALLPSLALAGSNKGKGLKKIDTNKDGVITQAEVENSDATRLIENFAEIDADSNGELTMDELRAHRKKGMEERRAKVQEADTDGNGAISQDEAAKAGMQKLLDNFDVLDANGDGEVTRDEVREFHRAKKGQRKGNDRDFGQGKRAE